MLKLNVTKQKIFRVLFALVICVSLMAPAALFAHGGGGGGGGGGFSGGGGHMGGGGSSFSGGGHMGGGSSFNSGGFSHQSFSAPSSPSMGRSFSSSPSVSRSSNFSSSPRMSSAPSASFSHTNSGISSNGGFAGNRSVSTGSSAPLRFSENHASGSAINTTQSARVNHQAIATPLSQSARTSRSDQFARSASSGATTARATASSGTSARSNHRMDIMRPLSSTARDGFVSSSHNAVSGNRNLAANMGSQHSWNSGNWSRNGSNWSHNGSNNNWSHNGSHNNNWSHNNWGHGDIWNNHHHNHCDFDDNVFVFVGGFWPFWWYAGYPYYWYPWYGYGGPAYYDYYPAGGSTYNSYNYYDDTGALQPGSTINGMQVPDYDALSAVNQKTNPQATEAPANNSDKLFDEGVQAFGRQEYHIAVDRLQAATALEPADTVLPFAYAQALFANKQYDQAAAVISLTLSKTSTQQAEIFYPRGMYKDQNVLMTQIEDLRLAVQKNPADVQLQLLYGYQLLGIGRVDEAVAPLTAAKNDELTAVPAKALLDLLDRIQKSSQKDLKQ